MRPTLQLSIHLETIPYWHRITEILAGCGPSRRKAGSQLECPERDPVRDKDYDESVTLFKSFICLLSE